MVPTRGLTVIAKILEVIILLNNVKKKHTGLSYIEQNNVTKKLLGADVASLNIIIYLICNTLLLSNA